MIKEVARLLAEVEPDPKYGHPLARAQWERDVQAVVDGLSKAYWLGDHFDQFTFLKRDPKTNTPGDT